MSDRYSDLYVKMKTHYEEWCKFDLMNIGDRAMQAVNQKQWTVSRLHDFKKERIQLLKKKKKISTERAEELVNTKVNLDKKTLLDDLETYPPLEDINEQLRECDELISYMEDMLRVMSFIAQDVKNCLDAIKMETM